MGSNYIPERDRQEYKSRNEEIRPQQRDEFISDNRNSPVNLSGSDKTGQSPRTSALKSVPMLVVGFLIGLVLAAAVLGGLLSGKIGGTAEQIERSSDDQIEESSDDQFEESSDDSMELTDSWEEIAQASEDGTYRDRYRIGDTKELDLGEEGVVTMKLVAMDADELSYSSGYAPMTWIAEDLLNSEQFMNTEESIEGGWPASYMRDWLRDEIFTLFPEDVKDHIKTVNKYSFDPEAGTVSSRDVLWIPSAREIYGDYSDEEEGPEYTEAFQGSESWKKHHIGESDISQWYLRSAIISVEGNKGFIEGSDGGAYDIPGHNGSSFYYSVTDVLGVLIGFCL